VEEVTPWSRWPNVTPGVDRNVRTVLINVNNGTLVLVSQHINWNPRDGSVQVTGTKVENHSVDTHAFGQSKRFDDLIRTGERGSGTGLI
jgi:hypothetical protein